MSCARSISEACCVARIRHDDITVAGTMAYMDAAQGWDAAFLTTMAFYGTVCSHLTHTKFPLTDIVRRLCRAICAIYCNLPGWKAMVRGPLDSSGNVRTS
jgi:hypothetical protein